MSAAALHAPFPSAPWPPHPAFTTPLLALFSQTLPALPPTHLLQTHRLPILSTGPPTPHSCTQWTQDCTHWALQVVIDIDGDGSFLMNCQELATIFIEKLDVKCFIMNNQHLGMVVQWEDRFYKKNRAHTYLGHRVRPALSPASLISLHLSGAGAYRALMVARCWVHSPASDHWGHQLLWDQDYHTGSEQVSAYGSAASCCLCRYHSSDVFSINYCAIGSTVDTV